MLGSGTHKEKMKFKDNLKKEKQIKNGFMEEKAFELVLEKRPNSNIEQKGNKMQS